MAIHEDIDFEDIPRWCAGVKISGLNEESIQRLTNKNLIDSVFDQYGQTSCLVASVNITEKDVIKWLIDNKWTPGPKVSNWNHGGRKTLLYFKQITRARYNRG